MSQQDESRATHTPEEVASLLGVHYRTILAAIHRGEIAPVTRVGSRILVPRWVVDRMLAREGAR